MIGAIIGDIVGSIYEFPEYQDLINGTINVERRKSVFKKNLNQLLAEDCFFSDDTILTVAIADAIISDVDYGLKLKEYGLKYLNINDGRNEYFKCSFSPNFTKWLKKNEQGKSNGNGAGMRVSPVGYLFDNLLTVNEQAMKCTIPSHNTKPAIWGARAIASSIILARQKWPKNRIKSYIELCFKYDLNLNLEILQNTNMFNPTCEITVPQAIFVFLESNSFEDAIKKAVSIGGDTDTIACMTGAIAEAYYGIPRRIVERVNDYCIPPECLKVISNAYSKVESI